MKKNKTLILGHASIERLLDMKEAIKEVERAFSLYGKGQVQMPPKVYLDLKKYGGDFRAMPAYVQGMGAALKWVNVHPANKSKNLPTVMATVILSDPRTGLALAILDGTKITNYRTGASGAVAAKYLASSASSVVALVGCGEQAKTQLLGLEGLFKIKEVRVWGNTVPLARQFIAGVKNKKCKFIRTKTIKECVDDADIVVTTTPSRKPLLKGQWLKKTAHINAIGADAPGKQELEPTLLKTAKLVIDDWRQASHSGEINVALRKKIISKRHVYACISDIINNRKKGRTKKDGITVFDSTGLAIQDAALAHLIYRKAKRKKIGRFTNFVGY